MITDRRNASLLIRGPISRADLAGLSTRVCAFFVLNTSPVLDCFVVGVEPDVVAVEALCRLELVAQRRGCRVVLRNAPADLRDLVALLGLADVLLDEP